MYHDEIPLSEETMEQLKQKVAGLNARIRGAVEAAESAHASYTHNDLDGWELQLILSRLKGEVTDPPEWIPAG